MPFCRGSESQRSIYLIVLYDTIIVDSMLLTGNVLCIMHGRDEKLHMKFSFLEIL